jgi:hypothetical protein
VVFETIAYLTITHNDVGGEWKRFQRVDWRSGTGGGCLASPLAGDASDGINGLLIGEISLRNKSVDEGVTRNVEVRARHHQRYRGVHCLQ